MFKLYVQSSRHLKSGLTLSDSRKTKHTSFFLYRSRTQTICKQDKPGFVPNLGPTLSLYRHRSALSYFRTVLVFLRILHIYRPRLISLTIHKADFSLLSSLKIKKNVYNITRCVCLFSRFENYFHETLCEFLAAGYPNAWVYNFLQSVITIWRKWEVVRREKL